MPRHKEFDRDSVLDQAMKTFWSKGYEATSIQDLIDRMGINRGSLSHTFGDKRGLFLAAPERYESAVTRELLAILERPGSGKAALRGFFLAKIRWAATPGRPQGCLMTKLVVERSLHDRETAARVGASLSKMEEAF